MRYKGDSVTSQTMRMDAKPLVTEMRDVPEDPDFPLLTKRRPITVPGPPKAKPAAQNAAPGIPKAASQPPAKQAGKQPQQDALTACTAQPNQVHQPQQDASAVLQDAPVQLPQPHTEAPGNSPAAPSGKAWQRCVYHHI